MLNIIEKDNVDFCFNGMMNSVLIAPDDFDNDSKIRYRYIVSKVVI